MKGANAYLTATEVAIVAAAMDWYESQWPFDPESQRHSPPTQFIRESGEVLPPRVEVRHYDGWRIGWIETVDGLSRFVRDYMEDPE